MEIDDLVLKQLLKEVTKEIDIKKLAKELAPQVINAIKKDVILQMKNFEMEDFIYNCIPEKELAKFIKDSIKQSLNKK